jgi:integrase
MQQNPITWSRKNPTNRRARLFIDEEWSQLLAVADDLDAKRSGFLGTWLRLSRETGMRKSELLNLTWPCITKTDQFGSEIAAAIDVLETKNHDDRTVFIDKTTYDLLISHKQLLNGPDNRLVFPSSNRNPKYRYGF